MSRSSVVQPCRHSPHVATDSLNVATSTIFKISCSGQFLRFVTKCAQKVMELQLSGKKLLIETFYSVVKMTKKYPINPCNNVI